MISASWLAALVCPFRVILFYIHKTLKDSLEPKAEYLLNQRYD